MIDSDMKLLVRLMVVAGLFAALPVCAEPVNLSMAYQKALEYDAQVRAANADYLVSKEEIAKARAEFRPRMNMSALQGRDETKSIAPGPYGVPFSKTNFTTPEPTIFLFGSRY